MTLQLTLGEQAMLDGKQGYAARKCMEILVALGKIYGAERLIPVSSVQVAGVSYDNLGEAGLEFLETLARGGGKARVLATLNPAGMDVDNWRQLGISEDFALKQNRVIQAYIQMGILATCTCTPYLVGNLPRYGEHVAWAESSAVCYVNSVIGAHSNREGGPSALAAALTGVTPEYGLHLEQERAPQICIEITGTPPGGGGHLATAWFGALGKAIGEALEKKRTKPIPLVRGLTGASPEELKALCASLATYGGVALMHLEGITPEAGLYAPPAETIRLTAADVEKATQDLRQVDADEVDFISLGCPHLSIREIAYVAARLEGKRVQREFWITTARPTRRMADKLGYTRSLEDSGVKFASDTCCVVAPIKGRFHAMGTDSAKAGYYGYAKNAMRIYYGNIDEILDLATRPARSGAPA
jgi:predicted aconitase